MKYAIVLLVLASVFSQSFAIPYLRQLIQSKGKWIGTAVSYDQVTSDAAAETLVGQQFNLITAENEMKWGATEATRGRFTYTQGDAILAYAQKNNQTVRGHNLCWGEYNPSWLSGLSASALQQALIDHINNVTIHYKGKVYCWDVVNEAVSDSPNGNNVLKQNVWYPALPNYIDIAFNAAHAADPNAKLFYNDYSAEVMNAKSDAVYNLLKGMKQRGIPVHGVGLQCHFKSQYSVSIADISRNIQRLTDLGLEVHITEFDYGITGTSQEQQQATFYSSLFQACLQSPACKSFETWGFTDKHTWLGSDELPLPFDVNYQPKPAFNALAQALGGR